MKKILLIAIMVVFASCKEDKKEVKTPETKTTIDTLEVKEVTYPKLSGLPKALNFIFDNGFEFTEDIKIDYIALQPKGDNNYQIIYGLTEDSNFERIETLKVSANFYAENPNLFEDALYKKRKVRQVPMAVKINSLDGAAVISQEFKMIPKKYSQIKFYFYSDKGVENERILTLRNITLPQ